MTRCCLIFIVINFMLLGCRDSQGLPKPRAYPRIEFPDRNYTMYSAEGCPFTFEYPSFAEIRPKDENCWFDLYMPAFAARIHCSYLPVKSEKEFEDLIDDSFEIAERINARANYMEESRLTTDHGIHGLLLEWTGPAASPMHFFLTDTTRHFFKAALYFDSRVKPDSLAPVVEFIKQDIRHMLSTFEWKE